MLEGIQIGGNEPDRFLSLPDCTFKVNKLESEWQLYRRMSIKTGNLLEITWQNGFIPAAPFRVGGLAAMPRKAEEQGIRWLAVPHQPCDC